MLTFGSARGSNALANVERLHVIGRPMPPGDELVYLAQVLHHDDGDPVSGQLELRRPKYGGQRYEVAVADYVDSRVSALPHARREDELFQVLHRARLTTFDPQELLTGLGSVPKWRQVRLVLLTNHPVPGLRVDQMMMGEPRIVVNDARKKGAETRVLAGVDRLRQRADSVTVTNIAYEARAHKATVSKDLGQLCIPVENSLDNGMHRVSKSPDNVNHLSAERLDCPGKSTVVREVNHQGGSHA